MTPIDDASLVFQLLKNLQKRVAALEELDIDTRLGVIEARCNDHAPVIADIKDKSVRSDERKKTYQLIWAYISGFGIFLGLAIALLSNLSKIIEVMLKMIK